MDPEAGAFEAVRAEVFGQHAPGGIDGEEDVDAAAFDLAEFEAFLRSGSGDAEEKKREEPEETLGEAEARRVAGEKPGAEAGVNEQGEGGFAAFVEEEKQPRQEGAQQRCGIEPKGAGKLEGGVFHGMGGLVES